MDIRFVKPILGRLVRMPHQGYAVLPTEGTRVPWSTHWIRRHLAGDIEVIEPKGSQSKAHRRRRKDL